MIQKSDERWCTLEDACRMPEKAFRELPQLRVDIPLQDITGATFRCNLRPIDSPTVPHIRLAQAASYIRPHAQTRSL